MKVASYNLTESQKDLLQWIVDQVREEKLPEEFRVSWYIGGCALSGFDGDEDEAPDISKGKLNALHDAGLLRSDLKYKASSSGSAYESSRLCTLTGSAYKAVDSDFGAPDMGYAPFLSPTSDPGLTIHHLDETLRERCLPVLSTGSQDEKNWDTAMRNAGVVLEERLRDVGGITDQNLVGRALVNAVFGDSGTLTGKFNVSSERVGYRDLFAGVVGAVRNPSGHRFVDPSPEDGAATLLFINLLLKELEDLR